MANKKKVLAVRVTEEQEQRILATGIHPSEYLRNALESYEHTLVINEIINNLAKTLCDEERLLKEATKILNEKIDGEVEIEPATAIRGETCSYEIAIYVYTDSREKTITQLKQLFDCEVTENYSSICAVIKGDCSTLG